MAFWISRWFNTCWPQFSITSLVFSSMILLHSITIFVKKGISLYIYLLMMIILIIVVASEIGWRLTSTLPFAWWWTESFITETRRLRLDPRIKHSNENIAFSCRHITLWKVPHVLRLERQITTIRSSAEAVLVQQISKVEVIMGRQVYNNIMQKISFIREESKS